CLPDKVSPKACLSAAGRAVATVREAHAFEDSVLWPVLRHLRPGDGRLEETLARLHQEHLEDESYAEELAATLTDHAMCIGGCDPETTGYMLRGFFGALRRHVAFEREHIVPLLKDSLEDGS
ncbi:MAG: hemerythrin domain-containing protein, partial [Pseudomonadota bacterium]|nr:hemerythrin domain-containing protein [Pseudomonadota bacterium]